MRFIRLAVASLLFVAVATFSVRADDEVAHVKLQTLGDVIVNQSTARQIGAQLCDLQEAAVEVMLNSSARLREWAKINPDDPDADKWLGRFRRAQKESLAVSRDQVAFLTAMKNFEWPGVLGIETIDPCSATTPHEKRMHKIDEANQNMKVWIISK